MVYRSFTFLVKLCFLSLCWTSYFVLIFSLILLNVYQCSRCLIIFTTIILNSLLSSSWFSISLYCVPLVESCFWLSLIPVALHRCAHVKEAVSSSRLYGHTSVRKDMHPQMGHAGVFCDTKSTCSGCQVRTVWQLWVLGSIMSDWLRLLMLFTLTKACTLIRTAGGPYWQQSCGLSQQCPPVSAARDHIRPQ